MLQRSRFFSCAVVSASLASASASAFSSQQQQQQQQYQHPLLMRTRVACNSYAIITSCGQLTVNDSSFAQLATLNPWSSKLLGDFKSVLRASPTQTEITRLQQRIHGLMSSSSQKEGENTQEEEVPETHHHQQHHQPASAAVVMNIHETVMMLSLCYQTGVTPSESLLSRCEKLAPQLLSACNGSAQYLMLVVSLFDLFAPHRLQNILASTSSHIEAAMQSLRPVEIFILLTAFANSASSSSSSFSSSPSSASSSSSSSTASTRTEAFPMSLFETMIERVQMIAHEFDAHSVSEISLALAQHAATLSSSSRSPLPPGREDFGEKIRNDVQDTLKHDLGPRFVSQQELSTLSDACSMLFASSLLLLPTASSEPGEEGKKSNRELHEACARRIYLLLRDIDAENFAKTLCGLSRIDLKTPNLLRELSEISGKIDFSQLSPLAALDASVAAAQLGVTEDALFSRLTSTMMTRRSEILRNELAREKLLALADMIQN